MAWLRNAHNVLDLLDLFFTPRQVTTDCPSEERTNGRLADRRPGGDCPEVELEDVTWPM